MWLVHSVGTSCFCSLSTRHVYLIYAQFLPGIIQYKTLESSCVGDIQTTIVGNIGLSHGRTLADISARPVNSRHLYWRFCRSRLLMPIPASIKVGTVNATVQSIVPAVILPSRASFLCNLTLVLQEFEACGHAIRSNSSPQDKIGDSCSKARIILHHVDAQRDPSQRMDW